MCGLFKKTKLSLSDLEKAQGQITAVTRWTKNEYVWRRAWQAEKKKVQGFQKKQRHSTQTFSYR